MRRLLVLAALVFSLPAQAVTIDWVYIGDSNNPADTANHCLNSAANCGSVDHAYYISKYETTNAQYAEFLNEKAASDPLGLYNMDMGSNATFGGITQSGVSGSFTYTAKVGFENKPVIRVSFYDALRFANWLNNGQGSADTETGAYTLLGGTATPSNGPTVTRNPGAITFLTSENEWYKAAYYSHGGVYFDYPTGTDSVTECVAPGSDTGNSANCNKAVDALTNVGAYGLSDSPYGTYDQGGNVSEWNEQIVSGVARGSRGGEWLSNASYLAASTPYINEPTIEFGVDGFRVASLVPEPGPGLLGMTAVLSLAASRRRRANEPNPSLTCSTKALDRACRRGPSRAIGSRFIASSRSHLLDRPHIRDHDHGRRMSCPLTPSIVSLRSVGRRMPREISRRRQVHAAIEQHADIRAAQVVGRELSKTCLLLLSGSEFPVRTTVGAEEGVRCAAGCSGSSGLR